MKWFALILLAACGGSKANAPSSASSSTSSTSSESVEPSGGASSPEEGEQEYLENDPVELPKEKPVGGQRAPASAAPSSEAQQWVDAHNKVRAKHCAAPLTWSPKLAQIAQSWANTMKARRCAFEHSGNETVGENLAGGTAGALDPEGTVAMWYDEVKLYKFGSGGFSMQTGHFTQLVWTDTRQVGCGHVTCNGMELYVCNYDPPGNWEGQYREHVLPPSCKK
jgi:hypothetical protein